MCLEFETKHVVDVKQSNRGAAKENDNRHLKTKMHVF